MRCYKTSLLLLFVCVCVCPSSEVNLEQEKPKTLKKSFSTWHTSLPRTKEGRITTFLWVYFLTLNFTFYTHLTLYFKRYTLSCTLQFTFYTLHSALYTTLTFCILHYTLHFNLHLHSTFCILHFILCVLHSTCLCCCVKKLLDRKVGKHERVPNAMDFI